MARMTPNLSKADLPPHLAAPVQKVKLKLYVGFFTLGFVIASVLFMMIQNVFTLNPQLVTGLSIVTGAYVAVFKFIKHQQRVLSTSEANWLTLSSTLVVWLLTALYFLGLWLFLFDAASREVLTEMTLQQPMPLLFALVLMIVLTLIFARFSIWLFNVLLNPNSKLSSK